MGRLAREISPHIVESQVIASDNAVQHYMLKNKIPSRQSPFS